ncbi:armadillo-type protein [Xylariaceae sp. FL0594]|nr:armadillo-type protein [Xylariaceae sp. FL0594]
MEDDIPYPTSLPEVEKLVIELYNPNRSRPVRRINEILQQFQKSSAGWKLAYTLLERPDTQVKFFGALTLIVKLNTDRLSDHDALEFLQSTITWLIQMLANSQGVFVIKKLCSALVTFFKLYYHLWPRCIRHLICCLARKAAIPIEDAADSLPLEQIIQGLDAQSLQAACWFGTALAEDTDKMDLQKFAELHERVRDNAGDVAVLIGYTLGLPPDSPAVETKDQAMQCLQAWAIYAQRTSPQPLVQMLRSLVEPVIHCLKDEEMYGPSVELLTDLLANWPQLFTPSHIDSLWALFETEWARQKYELLVGGSFDFEDVQFGEFMIAFGESQMTEMTNATTTRAQALLAGLAGLMSAQGRPVAEDKIFVPALEFWSSFVEELVQTVYGDEGSTENVSWDRPPLAQVMQVVSLSWQKIQYPPVHEYTSWDSADRAAFGDARNDVSDFLQSVYTISGLPLIYHFVDLILAALSKSAWAKLEAASFCLGGLSDGVSEGESYDDAITKVFGSSLFDLLRQDQDSVPVRTRQSCLYLIARYSDYFARHAELLPAALNLLFTSVNDRHLALSSSKSIHKLCSSCSLLLTTEIDVFLEHYGRLRSNPDMDSLAEEKIVGAIAAIIQSLPRLESKISSAQRLLEMIMIDFSASLVCESSPADLLLDRHHPEFLRAFDWEQRLSVPVASAHEVAVNLVVRGLRCLCSMAKGLQAPQDLDSELDEAELEGTREAFAGIHAQIFEILKQLKAWFSSNAEVVDVICAIVRAGFSEREPGLFVLPPAMVTELVTSNWQSRTAALVSLATAFVNSLYAGIYKQHLQSTLDTLLPWVLNLLHQQPAPNADPELSQYGIEFACMVLRRRPDSLMQQPASALEFVFTFALKLLEGNEPLSKGAAAEFWTAFIVAKGSDVDAQARLDEVMTHFGPRLARCLMQNVGGGASRSELDKVTDPLKKLVTRHISALKWLEAALDVPGFPSNKVDASQKSAFLRRIIGLRGARATNQVVKEFWLACRGPNLAYAS